ncbi:MAG: CDP-diacylglycerol--glycerol-3-phosphate 3-phosphatidyltransferase [Clostridia bacterium]|nr:CDP-diacylglycerol--glycerol-3-phosphate 3-phosphatidyltransferase [Clostridia bacterium]
MNLANKLTLLRIFLIPLFMLIFLIRIPYGQYIATGIFIIAASTDGLDGYIARKRKQITNFGKLMDPLADKLLITAALIVLVELRLLASWIAFIIIGREFFVTGLRTIAAAEGVIIAASKLGKLKTVTQIVAIIALLLNVSFGKYLMCIAVFFTLWSGIDYYLHARKKLRLKTK